MSDGIDVEKMRHSAAHVLAAAVLRLFPDAKTDIGPSTRTGFYYDFDIEHQITQDDLIKIEDEMRKIVSEDQKFIRKVVSREGVTTVDIYVIVRYGFRIPEVAFDIQEHVKSNVENQAGVLVDSVNIHVQGVDFSEAKEEDK